MPRNKVLFFFLLTIYYGNRGIAQSPVPTPAVYPLTLTVNSVRTWIPTRPMVNDADVISSARTLQDLTQSTQYLDGLGRPLQTVQKQMSPLGNDIVTAVLYDSLGRPAYSILPFSSNVDQAGDVPNDGNLKADPFQQQRWFYSDSDLNSPIKGQGETYYFGQINYEPSPLNRILETFAPGNTWVGTAWNGNSPNTNLASHKSVQQQYLVNTALDSVQIWTIAAAQGSIPTDSGTYAMGTLYKNVTQDEAGNQVITYVDMEGRTILKKVQVAVTPGIGHSGWLCTYYVYDDLNHLRFVIPPQAVQQLLNNSTWNISSLTNLATGLCFRYEYDQRGRMIIKKIPGAGEIWTVYDSRDRLMLTEDANLRSGAATGTANQWRYTKFDDLNRPVLTGLYTDNTNTSQNAMQTAEANAEAARSPVGPGYETINFSNYPEYSLTGSYPAIAFSTVQIVTYYDNYSWDGWYGFGNMDNSYNSYFAAPSSSYPYPQALTQSVLTRGLVTGVWDAAGPGLLTGTWYDDKARVIQTKFYNYTGGIDETTTQYDFSGKPLQTYLRHQNLHNTAQTHYVNTIYSYDPQGRLKTVYKNIDNAAANQLIDSVQYDELGHLRAKYLGNNVDSLIYAYNIRDWMIGINKNYVAGTTTNFFGMELGYDKTTSVAPGNTYATPEFNGNIEGVAWKTAGSGLNRKYDFAYDKVNRLTGAFFQQNSSGTGWDSATVCYSTSKLYYDANGNILSMNQKGFMVGGSNLIDQLTYTYPTNSNQLGKVVDAVNNPNSQLSDFHSPSATGGYNYSYDGNGNLTLDSNKSINFIHYNYLNLPDSVSFTGKGYIKYVYDNAGNKLTKTVVDNLVGKATATTYVSGVVYQRSAAPPVGTAAVGGLDTLQFIGHEEGRARWAYHNYLTVPAGYRLEYDFFEKDHLGNTRMVLTQERDTTNYIATMEAVNRTTESKLFGNIASTCVAWTAMPNYQNIPNNIRFAYTSPNDSVSKVDYNGTSGQTTGVNLLLKVMAGDIIMPGVQCYYANNTITTTNSSFSSVLNSLAAGILGTSTGGAEGTLSGYTSSGSPVYSAVTNFLSSKDQAPPSGYPKAYLNWILLDDQFNYVSSASGSIAVASSTYPANQFNTIAAGGPIVMPRNGYIYVWVSNETQGWDVFFDNFTVQYKQGPVLEENHYYPFGLTMAGISDKALKTNYAENKYRYNKGSELQNKEFSDGSGLEMYETNLRELDPQLGRWWQIDPVFSNGVDGDDEANDVITEGLKSQSPYASMDNNPVLRSDPNGDCPICVIVIIIGLLTTSEPAVAPSSNHAHDLQDNQAINKAHTDATLHAAGSLLTGGAKTIVAVGKAIYDSKQGASTQQEASPSQKPRNAPASDGIPNSSKIDAKDATGKTTKYSTYDEHGHLVKQVEGDRGVSRHGVEGATKKIPTQNTLPDGTVKPGKLKTVKATPDETPPGNNNQKSQ
jgi:RHS repeat-associated protein